MAKDFGKALGNAAIKVAGQVSKTKANAPKVEMISISLIDENPDNELIFSMDEIERLSESIKTEGFRGAIDVFKKPDGRYEISSGHRRIRAAVKAGLTEIPCFVNAMPDDIVRARRLLDGNITNRVLKPLDYARSIDYYINFVLKPSGFKGQVNKECASYFNISASNVYRYRSLLSMDESLQTLANDERFPFSAFSAAHRLSREGQKDLAEFLIKQLKDSDDAGVSKSLIEAEIRKRLKEEDSYKEAQNKEIAEKHKRNTNEKSWDSTIKSLSSMTDRLSKAELDKLSQEEKDSLKDVLVRLEAVIKAL